MRHTVCELVPGVHTCALPIYLRHAPFVHKGLLGDRNPFAIWDFSYGQGPRHIVERRVFAARPAVPAWAKAYGDAFAPVDGPMDHWQETYWYAPANMLLDAGLVMPDAQRGTGIDIIGLNLMTPETETTTHYFYGIDRKSTRLNSSH